MKSKKSIYCKEFYELFPTNSDADTKRYYKDPKNIMEVINITYPKDCKLKNITIDHFINKMSVGTIALKYRLDEQSIKYYLDKTIYRLRTPSSHVYLENNDRHSVLRLNIKNPYALMRAGYLWIEDLTSASIAEIEDIRGISSITAIDIYKQIHKRELEVIKFETKETVNILRNDVNRLTWDYVCELLNIPKESKEVVIEISKVNYS